MLSIVLSVLATILTAVSVLPQIIKIIKSKSRHSIPENNQLFSLLTGLSWLIWGLKSEEYVLSIAALISFTGHMVVYLRSKNKSKSIFLVGFLALVLPILPSLSLELLASTFSIISLVLYLKSPHQEVVSALRFTLELIEEFLWTAWAIISTAYLIALPSLVYIPVMLLLLNQLRIKRAVKQKYDKALNFQQVSNHLKISSAKSFVMKTVNIYFAYRWSTNYWSNKRLYLHIPPD